MKINEIFYSIEGEGKRVGHPCVFIRRSGCNLHCLYDGKDCDTPYRDEGVEMSVNKIMAIVRSYGCNAVTLTGGEPLLPHPQLLELRQALRDEGYEVNIETNGTMETKSRFSNEFFTVDYKCNCSGMSGRMQDKAFSHLKSKDVIKLVVSEEDFEQAESVVKMFSERYVYTDLPFIYLSPCFGRCDYAKLAELVKKLYARYPRIGMNLQIHKIIWAPETRGV